ncbi:MAG: hypothetical protein JW862_18960 [Anaerolineales bacterium]|nr:hypothetical protein [Anaerolineales bacterium]
MNVNPPASFPWRQLLRPSGLLAFALAAAFAILQDWSLPEFCWSTWLAGLVFGWVVVLAALARLILAARAEQPRLAQQLPLLEQLPPTVFLLGAAALAAGAAWLALRLYSFVFGFYGLFLSVFASMPPETLFGPDGFINSDFYTPVAFLLVRFWPVVLGLLVANWELFLRPQSWQQAWRPLERRVLRLHLLVLAQPFFSLLAWFLLGERYQTLAIVLLLAWLYLPARVISKQSRE